jgi:signal transduction histidine kinase
MPDGTSTPLSATSAIDPTQMGDRRASPRGDQGGEYHQRRPARHAGDHRLVELTTESYELVLTEVSRLKRLARDFSTIAQLNEGAVSLQRVPTDIGQLVISVADRLRPQYQTSNIELITGIGLGEIRDVDPDRVSQILTNLLGNALVYTPAGGRVTATCRSTASGLQIAVTDTGIGLTASDTTRVFERFYRVANVARPPGGTGIGLSIAQRFARLHRGDLTCTSPGLGHGTTFTLTLP